MHGVAARKITGARNIEIVLSILRFYEHESIPKVRPANRGREVVEAADAAQQPIDVHPFQNEAKRKRIACEDAPRKAIRVHQIEDVAILEFIAIEARSDGYLEPLKRR